MQISNIPGAEYSNLVSQMQQSKTKSESFESALDEAIAANNKEEIKKSCIEFESYFVHMMFKEMRKTLHPEQGILPPSRAEEYFQDMLDEESSKRIAEGQGIGLADMMYKQLTLQLGE